MIMFIDLEELDHLDFQFKVRFFKWIYFVEKFHSYGNY